MTDFSREEVLKLAEISSLKLTDDEVDELREQLAKTIDYTQKLNEFQGAEEHDAIKTINVFREDKVIKTDSGQLLAQAPKTKDTYFVVPKILDQS